VRGGRGVVAVVGWDFFAGSGDFTEVLAAGEHVKFPLRVIAQERTRPAWV